MTPRSLHRTAAWLEMGTWTLLLVGMALKYSNTTEAVMPFAGGIHGFGFLSFAAMTILLWVNNRWPAGVGLAGLLVSVIPYAALPFALWADKKGLLEGGWRFRDVDADATPRGPVDTLLAQVTRHPVRSILIILVLITIVFSVLLTLGPPVDVEGTIRGE
ncbi:DUF3817 domain-containing protein [Corynebacterium incognita]|uniref:DUF3817 domain-containing protein n=1 Tax=Corynebacterium incognita TaxID=2754725 RepID=A0A7G7CPZ9_9CORY|nr:DUF3817 domain-containing protein [Corynebacterium incognita]QNE89665.1 DUF3817 domain-containing protein [Corynebacterium incognita]